MATADDFVAAGCAPAPIAAALARGAPAPEIDFQQRPHAGPYQLLARLGRGGMAELFLAQRRGPGGFRKLVAVKRILPHLADDALFADMFVNEGRIAAQLQHPNLCQVYELGADGSNVQRALPMHMGIAIRLPEPQRPSCTETSHRTTLWLRATELLKSSILASPRY